MVWESLDTFWQTPSGLPCAFHWGVASVWPLYHKGLIGGVLQRWLSFWKVLPSPQRNSVRGPIGFMVTSLSKALLPRLLSLAKRLALGRDLVVPNFFHLRMMEATVFLGTFNAADNTWYPSPDLCLDTIPSTSCLSFCSDVLLTVGPYIDRCVPFQIMSNQFEFTTGGLQSCCRNISSMINVSMLHLSSISSLRAKGLDTCVNEVFLFSYLIHLIKLRTCFCFVIMGYCM
jgi:hypothetical protein